jgi:hypothetical protein
VSPCARQRTADAGSRAACQVNACRCSFRTCQRLYRRRRLAQDLDLLNMQVDLLRVVAAHDAGKARDGQGRVIGQVRKESLYVIRVIAAHR